MGTAETCHQRNLHAVMGLRITPYLLLNHTALARCQNCKGIFCLSYFPVVWVFFPFYPNKNAMMTDHFIACRSSLVLFSPWRKSKAKISSPRLCYNCTSFPRQFEHLELNIPNKSDCKTLFCCITSCPVLFKNSSNNNNDTIQEISQANPAHKYRSGNYLLLI